MLTQTNKENMKKNKAIKEIQANLLKLMKTEGTDWAKCWVGHGLPQNVKTKKHYRGGNLFFLNVMVHINNWKCNEWGTFKQWNSLGYKIKKGSKGMHVYYWELREKKESWLTDEERAKYLRTKELPKYLSQRDATVFNGEQIEDYDFKKIAKHEAKLSDEVKAEVTQFIDNTQAKIFDDGGDSAYYHQFTDTIHMPVEKAFFSDEDYFSVLLHELSHWTMTEERTNRVKENLDYANEELVAEIGSAFLCAYLGISKTPRKDHAQYLNNWIQHIEESDKAMTKAFSLAQKAMDCLIDLQQNKVKEVA